jgi:hypothetical protein
MKIRTTLLSVYLVVSPILLVPSESLAQKPSAALQAKTVDAVSILAKAARGRARIIVQYRVPASLARAAIGTPKENIAAIVAENQVIQDSILLAYFGAVSELTTPSRGLTRMSISPGFAINASASEIEGLANDDRVMTIELDRMLSPHLIQSVPLIGMTSAYANGATGNGWAVAVLDTGVETNHTFISNLVAEACLSTTQGILGQGGSASICPGGVSFSTAVGSGAECDISWLDCGHGTFVAGIAVGSNRQFQFGQPQNGVARSGSLIAIKIYSRFTGRDCPLPATTCVYAWASDFTRALDQVFTIRNTLPGGVLVASVTYSGGYGLYSGSCDGLPSPGLLKASIDRLRSVGIPTIISAGGDKSRTQISYPACISSAIAVSASSKTDAIPEYSNMSTQVAVLAPGGDGSSTDSDMILSSVAAGFACASYTGPKPSTGGSYCYLQGTSAAAPHVAGAWAALMSKVPNFNVSTVLDALIITGRPIRDVRSSGTITKTRIDVDAALQALLQGLTRQTWDFGRDNDNSFSAYYWIPVEIEDLNRKLICINRWGTQIEPCAEQMGALRAPEGFKVCAATIDMRSTGIPEPSSFNGGLQDVGSHPRQQFAWYAEFGGDGPQPLSARVYIDLVRENFDRACMNAGPIFLCGVGANNRQGCTEVQLGGVKR